MFGTRSTRHGFYTSIFIVELWLFSLRIEIIHALLSPPPPLSYPLKSGNILLLDHLNINHEKGRHDLLKVFYFDTLGMAIDPRKIDNINKGRKTIWANAGITQFHLPEEIVPHHLDGMITLSTYNHETYLKIANKIQNPSIILQETKFSALIKSLELFVTDPWGNLFKIIDNSAAFDPRGMQPGTISPLTMSDLCIHVPQGKSLQGIARFYEYVLQAPTVYKDNYNLKNNYLGSKDADEISIITSPYQTLTFKTTSSPQGDSHIIPEINDENGQIIANDGPHISMYIQDFSTAYQRAASIGSLFVNTRFKRQAHTLEEAIEQCMFRCLDIIDPEDVKSGPILRFEHEIRSVTNPDGTKYKSCPLKEIL